MIDVYCPAIIVGYQMATGFSVWAVVKDKAINVPARFGEKMFPDILPCLGNRPETDGNKGDTGQDSQLPGVDIS